MITTSLKSNELIACMWMWKFLLMKIVWIMWWICMLHYFFFSIKFIFSGWINICVISLWGNLCTFLWLHDGKWVLVSSSSLSLALIIEYSMMRFSFLPREYNTIWRWNSTTFSRRINEERGGKCEWISFVVWKGEDSAAFQCAQPAWIEFFSSIVIPLEDIEKKIYSLFSAALHYHFSHYFSDMPLHSQFNLFLIFHNNTPLMLSYSKKKEIIYLFILYLFSQWFYLSVFCCQ